MKVVLYGSLSANGYFIEANAQYATPQEVLMDFVAHVKKHKNLIVGRKTYDLLLESSSSAVFEGVELVVVSGKPDNISGAHKADSPQAAIEYLKSKGFESALVGGGALLDSSMLSEGLVNELYINILPVLTGPGVTISGGDDSFARLELLESHTLTPSITQLHYTLL
jgi:dihydrofolate reductase